jgi:ribosomal protein S18 acetylase RimI-like enzyme
VARLERSSSSGAAKRKGPRSQVPPSTALPHEGGREQNALGRNDEVNSRSVEPGDREFLRSLYASTREAEMAIVPWTDEEKDRFLRMQFEAQDRYYREQFRNAEFSVMEMGGRPIGRLSVDRRKDEIRIIDIALLPEHRGKGIGSRVMESLLKEAGKAGKPVRIHVEKNNPALRLYKRLGFEKIEDQGVYDLMEWRFDASA